MSVEGYCSVHLFKAMNEREKRNMYFRQELVDTLTSSYKCRTFMTFPFVGKLAGKLSRDNIAIKSSSERLLKRNNDQSRL